MLNRSINVTEKLPDYTQLEVTKIVCNWNTSKDWVRNGQEKTGKSLGFNG